MKKRVLTPLRWKTENKILRVSRTAKKTNEWVLNKAGVNRELLDTVKRRKLAFMVTSCGNKRVACRKRQWLAAFGIVYNVYEILGSNKINPKVAYRSSSLYTHGNMDPVRLCKFTHFINIKHHNGDQIADSNTAAPWWPFLLRFSFFKLSFWFRAVD